MMGRLKPEEFALLSEVITKRAPFMQYLVDGVAEGHISEEERDALQTILMDEFLSELYDNDEPNPRGIKLDYLIGSLTKVAPMLKDELDENEVARILRLDKDGIAQPEAGYNPDYYPMWSRVEKNSRDPHCD